MRNRIKSILGAIVMLLFLGTPSWAIILPDPIYPFAVQYDDFYSYSNAVLKDLYDKGQGDLPGDYYITTGTGTLDIILWNAPGSANPSPFDPAIKENTNPTAGDGYAVDYRLDSVDAIIAYLQYSDNPVFLYDLNQQGNDGGLWVSAYFWIADEAGVTYRSQYGDTTKSWWALDTNPNGELDTFTGEPGTNIGDYNGEYAAYAPNSITYMDLEGEITTLTGANVGSGHGDFIGYAPTMRLSPFSGDSWYLWSQFFFGNSTQDYNTNPFGMLDNGKEEVYLTGRVLPPDTVVPEPSALLLLGSGLLGLGAVSRYRRK